MKTVPSGVSKRVGSDSPATSRRAIRRRTMAAAEILMAGAGVRLVVAGVG